MPAVDEKIHVPPDETFWQRYSARHEFPLASTLSIVAHAAVIGILVGGAFWFSRLHNEERKPPLMDVVMLAPGGEGDGSPLGGQSGNGDPKTELTPTPVKEQPKDLFKPQPAQEPLLIPSPQIDPFDPQADFLKELEFVEKDAKRIQEVKDPPKPRDKVDRPIMPGVDKGKSGSGGPRDNGSSKAGPVGSNNRNLTKQEIYANRWRFDLSGSPREHVEKLTAAGVILALSDNQGGVFIIRQFNPRPVKLKREEDMRPFKDAVKWYNNNPQSLQGLARELGLPGNYVPQVVAMLLPKDREQKMADEEARFARESGRDPQQIRETWFDFVIRDGQFEPKAIRQQ